MCSVQNNGETLVWVGGARDCQVDTVTIPASQTRAQQFLWSLSAVISAGICLQSERWAFKQSTGLCPLSCCSVQSVGLWGCSGSSASPAAGAVWLQQPALLSCALLRAGTPLAPGWECQPHTQHWGTPCDRGFLQHCQNPPQPFHLAAFKCLS